ncbi:MAG TPA: hypothetical protein RWO66_02430 [Ruminococcus sp.]|uniref:Putative replisome organizer protein n=1 Tax=Siphoviridae sp. ctwhn18 TaxID=2825733 RepID=A0A8S5NYJ8_9CAUD|nr:MAG TPA: putative replisome organizer protein [Siphoviridae sp. ctwhn18]
MRTTAATNDPLFDRFWKAYPRKEGKPKAQKTFEKLKVTPELLQDIMSELNRQAKMKDWKHINTKYIPLAQTWLNRRDWEEEQCGAAEEHTDTGDQYGAVIC